MTTKQNSSYPENPYDLIEPLKWYPQDSQFTTISASGGGISYSIVEIKEGTIVLFLYNLMKGKTTREDRFTTIEEAKKFVDNTHYPHFMSQFVKNLKVYHET